MWFQSFRIMLAISTISLCLVRNTYITQLNWGLFNELAGTKIVFGVPMRHPTLYSLTVMYLLQEALWTALPA